MTNIGFQLAKKRNQAKGAKKSKKQKKKFKWPFYLVVISLNFFFLFSILFFIFIIKDLPSPKRLTEGFYPVSSQIFDHNGKLLYEIYAEKDRTPIKLQDLPESVKQATVAIEDKDFYSHKGLALRGITRAVYNIVFNQKLQGGSTITQQLVKTALLTPERTLRRKLREIVLSIATETLYSKDQILEMYLNHVPYGGTSYGIQKAAQRYFGKNAKDLSLSEAALLAGLPAAPTKYSPFGANPKLAFSRQHQVLEAMFEEDYISESEKLKAKSEKLIFAPQKTDIKAPHFVMYVKDLLVEKYGTTMVEQGGLKVTTSLDLDLQEFVQTTVASEVAKLAGRKVTNGAVLVTKPPTGEILAMVGSKDYFDTSIDGNVNLTTSLRQPGSSIKPINYAVGLIKGYTPATTFLDVPTCFAVSGQPLYCPKNYDGAFHGPAQMRFTLGNSYNIPAVKMLAVNGIESMIATASAMGITTWKDPSRYGLSLTLGGGEVKMVDMAVAFGVFANQGIKIDLNPILKVEDFNNQVLEEENYEKNPPAGTRALSWEVCFLISHILLDNNARTAAFGSNSSLVIGNHAVSVKTGTTDDLRDNWTIGYTPSFLVATWVGNNDNSPMNPSLVSGVTGAAPIWQKIMTKVLEKTADEWPKQPNNIEGKQICTFITQGGEENPDCHPRYEYFTKGTSPQNEILKKQIPIDKETGWPPLPDKTDNLEVQEHLVASDPLIKDYCLDCPEENRKPTVIDLQPAQK